MPPKTPDPLTPSLSIGQCATLACLLEATAPKVGNVHRGADFENLTFADFIASAVAIGPAMESAKATGVGVAVLEAVKATRQLVDTNTNLGMVLLLAPLAAIPREEPLKTGIGNVLRGLTPDDCRLVYEAIRLAQPGGMGKVEKMDVATETPSDLLVAMSAAADRDLVAQQYVTDFDLVLSKVAPWLKEAASRWSLTDAIIQTHLRLLAEYPDSLIARKCGLEMAQEVSTYAAAVLAAGSPGEDSYQESAADLDFFLRSDGHRRNPGTTADLIAAGLFVLLRDGRLKTPWT
ncbi:MAG: triphosphoribosyl-dephospho-CoA synthase [Planctomycetales bacterium]|nr:triphosphoribosyl-dephospho-CoA synthase [Planctomycetales bacterium]